MTDRNTQEQTEREVTYQTFSEFLQNTPPNQSVHISDLVDPYSSERINAPDLILHCSHESCNGDRFFRCIDEWTNRPSLSQDALKYLYIRYQCANCKDTRKVYSLVVTITTIPSGICGKIGEFPAYGPPVPSRLIKLIGPDREIFLNGYRCENQGLGIGAFAYYRRVVEHQKNRILEEIIKVSEKMDAPEDKINTLRAAIAENQFSTALKMVKDAIPEFLLIDGHSPMRLLHDALSRGVHELSDAECLERASTVRLVLGELSERLSILLKNKAELSKAISTFMHDKNSSHLKVLGL